MQSKVGKQQGRSMIEMLGVLAIIGVLSAGGIVGYSTAMENHKVNQFIEMADLAVAKAQITFKKYEGKDYGFAALCDADVLPYSVCKTPVQDGYHKGFFGENFSSMARINGETASGNWSFYDAEKVGRVAVFRPFMFIAFTFLSDIPVSACSKILTNKAWYSLGEVVSTEYFSESIELPIAPDTALALCQTRSDAYKSGTFMQINVFFNVSDIYAL